MTPFRARRLRLLGTCLLMSCAAFPLLAASKVTLTFEKRDVVAHVAPGATTVWFGVVQDRSGYHDRITTHRRVLVDDDGDGIVRHQPASGRAAVWMVVDLASGEYATSAGKGGSLRRRPLTPALLRSRGNGNASRVVQNMATMLVWVVRPGIGAWENEVDDGGPGDADLAADGGTTVGVETLRPVGNSPPPPTEFQRDDVVAILDPFALRLFDGRVAK